MRAGGLGLVLAGALLLACPAPQKVRAPDAAPVVAVAPPAPPAAAPTPVAAPPPPAPPAAAVTGASDNDEDLRAEEPEENPRSEVVKLKLIITPPAKGTVHWGRKKLADLQPGKMTVEAERPRNTGPIDLVIRADGFLPHHVRLFTDRDDKLAVHLVRTEQASSVFGYRRSAAH